MIVEQEFIETVFRKIKYIREEYRTYVLSGDANVVSIVDLRRVIETMYDLKIEVQQVPFEADFIRGIVERRQGSLKVFVRQGQSVDWMRFTAVKEMCHGVIDEEEDWSVKGVDTLEDILAEQMVQNISLAARATQSELLAELAAIELLYPFECRNIDIDKLEKDETSIIKIANYHQIPAAVVGKAVLDNFYKLSQALWDQVHNNSAS